MNFTTEELLVIKQALLTNEDMYSTWELTKLKRKFIIWDGYYFKVKDAGSFNDGDVILQIWKKDGLVSQFYVNRDRDPLEIVKKLEISAGNPIRDGRELL